MNPSAALLHDCNYPDPSWKLHHAAYCIDCHTVWRFPFVWEGTPNGGHKVVPPCPSCGGEATGDAHNPVWADHVEEFFAIRGSDAEWRASAKRENDFEAVGLWMREHPNPTLSDWTSLLDSRGLTQDEALKHVRGWDLFIATDWTRFPPKD